MKNRNTITLFSTIFFILTLKSPLVLSQISEGITLDKLNITANNGTGARPFAMGGAYTAVSDDALALLYNPAGLAQIRRKELSFGLHHTRSTISNDYSGIKANIENSTTAFGHIASVYPVPTYRGSLVFGFGVYRTGTSDLEYQRTGYIDSLSATVTNHYNQSGTIYKYILGAGIDISPKISIGANIAIWDQSIDFNEEIDQVYSATDWAMYTDDVSMDLDALSFDFGILMKLNQNIRTGICFSSPIWLSYSGDGTDSFEGEDWYVPELYGVIEEEYTLPMQFRGGISVNVPHTLISADFSYTDYSQTKHNGLELINRDNPSKDVLRDTWNANIGAEATIPDYPVKIRAGYSYTPLFINPMEELTHINEYVSGEVDLTQVWDYYEVIKERQYFAFGVGFLIDRVLKLDFGMAIGEFEKETTVLTEKREFTEAILSAAYRY